MSDRIATDDSVRRGNRLGFAFFRSSLRLFGLKGTYGLLYFVCLYYVLFDRSSYSAAMSYVSRRFRSDGRLKRFFYVYKIFINQGKNLIDRYCLLSGCHKFDFEVYGHDTVKTLVNNSDKGLILLTAHVGNWQAAMTSLDKFDKIVYLLMRPEDNIAVKEILDIDGDREHVKVIFTDSYLGGVVEMVNALNNGQIVSIMGDRSYAHNSVDVQFMGGIAHFPLGAYNIAAATGCPIVVFLSAKTDDTKYFVDISHVINPPARGRGRKMDNIRVMAEEYSRILEKFVNIYPLQWFVFSDIWASGPQEKTGSEEFVDA
jgi:predicted LPLAT superfamily acyltransferase